MDFTFTEQQREIRDAIMKLCEGFGPDYWLDRDNTGEYPEDFYQALAAGGWLSIAMPEEYGGSNLGIAEGCVMMEAIAESGAGLSGASAVHINIFGPHPVVKHGTKEQKDRFLPPLIAGKEKACFGVTEPNAGLNTSAITTKAERTDNGYVVHGQKMWTTTAQRADKLLLLARPVAELAQVRQARQARPGGRRGARKAVHQASYDGHDREVLEPVYITRKVGAEQGQGKEPNNKGFFSEQ